MREIRGNLWACLLFLAIVAAPAARAFGQGELERAKDEALQRKLRTELAAVTELTINGSFSTPEDRKKLGDVYGVLLERFQLSVNGNKLPEIRREFDKHLRNASQAPNTDVHKEITAILLREMEKLVADPKQPIVVRQNAILVLGELDNVVERGKTAPLPAVLPKLLAIYDDAQAEDTLRVAALTGILRHAAAGIADRNQVAEIQNRMLALAQNPQFLKKATPEAQVFVRQRALSILRVLRQPGVGNGDQVLQAALAILNDKYAPTSLKAYAAQTIGWMNLTSAHANHAEAVGTAIAQLVSEAISRPKAEWEQTLVFLYSAELALRGPESERPQPPQNVEGSPNCILRLADAKQKQYLQELASRLDDVIKMVLKAKPQPPENDPNPAVREKRAADAQRLFEEDLERAARPFREWLATVTPLTGAAKQ